jgi:hypothetical protein
VTIAPRATATHSVKSMNNRSALVSGCSLQFPGIIWLTYHIRDVVPATQPRNRWLLARPDESQITDDRYCGDFSFLEISHSLAEELAKKMLARALLIHRKKN